MFITRCIFLFQDLGLQSVRGMGLDKTLSQPTNQPTQLNDHDHDDGRPRRQLMDNHNWASQEKVD